MNRIFTCSAALVLLACAAGIVPAHAARTEAAKPLVAQTLDQFKLDADRIRKDMEPGGKYGHISIKDKSRVDSRLDDMQNLLTQHANAMDMQQKDKLALFNAQEEINGILNHNDNDRLICQHVAPVGSHIPVTTCRTYGEIMAERERTRNDLQRMQMTPQLRSGN